MKSDGYDGCFLSSLNIADSDLLRHAFELREQGVDAGGASDLIGTLIVEFAVGRCAFLATALARRMGREHMVCFHSSDDDRLLHAVLACSPQYDLPLVGAGVDILGRKALSRTQDEIVRACGPVRVLIGDMIPPESLTDAEADAFLDLARHLPWLRPFAGLPRNGNPPTVWQALSMVLALDDRIEDNPSNGAMPMQGAPR